MAVFCKKCSILGEMRSFFWLFLCERNTAMRLRFRARHTRVHSPWTLSNPRVRSWRKPIMDLMMPKTDSTVCLRSTYAARPVRVLSLPLLQTSSDRTYAARRYS